MRKSECPAYGKKCAKCKQENHFAIKCPRSKINRLHDDSCDETSDSADSDEYIDAIKSDNKEIKCRLLMPDKTAVDFQIDTGSSVNVLPAKFHPANLPLTPVKKTLHAWNEGKVTALGTYRHSLRNPANNRKYSIEFVIVRENFTPILGLRASQKLKFVTVHEDEFERVASLKLDDHAEVFSDSLGTLPGEHTLRLDDSIRPTMMPDRRVPISVRPKLKAELEHLVSLGVLAPVDEPTPWISQLVITQKKSGAIRVCIDPKELNKALLREHYTLPILEDTLHELSSSTVFTKADLAHGYWHIALDEPSSKLTTFQTCFGRYRWLRLPFGTCVSSEIFQKRLLESLRGLTGVVCVADDIIVHGKDLKSHDDNLEAFLLRCKDVGIRLNQEKLELRKDTITFLGHRISASGLEPDPEKVRAINEMNPPTSVRELRTFIGMVNYMAKFIPNLTLQPLTNLMKKDVAWNWSSTQQKTFEDIKRQLTSSPVLALYDPLKELTLENDASEYGIGAALRQEGRPVAFASRTLSDTERRYAQIEKEMLAVTYGLEKFHHYTFGRRVSVLTDHKPLVAISNKPLSKAPKRLQSMLLRAQLYNFELQYTPGSKIPVADALSRAPLCTIKTLHTVNNLAYSPVKESQWEKFQEAGKLDEEITTVIRQIADGWPGLKDDVPLLAKPYFPYRDELSLQDGIVLRGERLVVPKSLRSTIKRKCHAGHLGINSTLRRARDTVYWPGMSADIREYVETCGVCLSMPSKQPEETIISTDAPELPWEKVGSDIFSYEGKQYLVTTDYHSTFFEVDHLPDISAETVIKKTKKNFARHGIPQEVVTDSGTQYTAEAFKTFAAQWEFEHTLSSPGNHRANGAAEAAVKTAKRLFKRCRAAGEDPYLGLLNLRNTPSESTNSSPAIKLFGRRTRSNIVTTKEQLRTTNAAETKRKKDDHTASRVIHMNKTRSDLSILNPGQTVRLQPIDHSKAWREGTVIKQNDSRTYEVETKGKKFRRTRALLRPAKKAEHHVLMEKQVAQQQPLPTQEAPRQTTPTAKRSAIPRPSPPCTPRATPQPSPPSTPRTAPSPSPVRTAPQTPPPRMPIEQRDTPQCVTTPAVTTTRSGRMVRAPKRFEC